MYHAFIVLERTTLEERTADLTNGSNDRNLWRRDPERRLGIFGGRYRQRDACPLRGRVSGNDMLKRL